VTNWRVININGGKGKGMLNYRQIATCPINFGFRSFPGRNRSFYTCMHRLRFDHDHTPYRLFDWKIAKSPACCSCGFVPCPCNKDHLMLEYTRFDQQRQALKQVIISLSQHISSGAIHRNMTSTNAYMTCTRWFCPS
jgi:hypothetical protein